MNVQRGLIRELMLYVFKHVAEVGKKIVVWNVKAQLITVSRWMRKLHSGYMNLDRQVRQVFNRKFQECALRGNSGEQLLESTRFARHLYNLGKRT